MVYLNDIYCNNIAQVESSKRAFAGRADYAEYQGAPVEAFIAAGWRETVHKDRKTRKYRPALQYQTATGPRWRFIDGLEPRHDSPNGYKPSWYGELGVAALVLVNGAPGVVVARHYGIAAIAVSDGEQRELTAELIAELIAAGVTSVLIAADSDPTGHTSASSRAGQLNAAGIQARAVDLQLSGGGDIANFCKLHGEAAKHLLADLPTIAAAPPKPIFQRRETAAPATGNSVDWQAEHAHYINNVVKPTLEQRAEPGRGKRFHCIFTERHSHDDKDPSARISTQRDPDGIYLCHCGPKGGAHSWDAVAERLGLPPFMEWWLDERKPLFPTPAEQHEQRQPDNTIIDDAPTNGAWLPRGVSEGFYFALLQCGKGFEGMAMLFKIANDGIIKGLMPSQFTENDLCAANETLGTNVPTATLKRWFRALKDELFSNLGLESFSSRPRNDINSKTGRKALLYELLPLDEVRRNVLDAAKPSIIEGVRLRFADEVAFNTEDVIADALRDGLVSDEAADHAAQMFEQAKHERVYSQPAQKAAREKARRAVTRRLEQIEAAMQDTTPLPLPDGMPLNSMKALRVAVLRALKQRYGDALRSKKAIAQRLGMAENNVNHYLHLAGVKVERNFDEHAITTPHNIAKQVQKAAFASHGFPYRLVATAPDARESSAAASDEQFAVDALKSGAEVKVLISTANKHTVLDTLPEAPAPQAPAPKVDAHERHVEPRPPAKTYAGYPAEWLRAQVELAFDALGWRTSDGHLMNRETGVIAPPDPTLFDLIELFTGEVLATGDDLIDMARHDLGAMVRVGSEARR